MEERKIMRNKILISLIIVILVLTANYGIKIVSPKSNNQKTEKVTVLLDWFPNTNHTGLYVAKDKKYFQENKIEIKIIQPSEGENIQLVASLKADFAVSSQEAVTLARAKDIPVVSIAAIIQHNTSAFASLKKSNIEKVADFEGKRYGGWGSPIEEATLKALMENASADYSKIKNITIGTTDFFTSIGRDSDFQWIFYGWDGIEAERRGIKLNLIMLKDLLPVLDYYTPVIITSENHLNNKKNTVKKFMTAVVKGYEFAVDNPQEASEILIKNVPEINADLVRRSQKWLSSQYQAEASQWGIQKSQVWQRYADWLFEKTLIEKNINADKAFTNKFL